MPPWNSLFLLGDATQRGTPIIKWIYHVEMVSDFSHEVSRFEPFNQWHNQHRFVLADDQNALLWCYQNAIKVGTYYTAEEGPRLSDGTSTERCIYYFNNPVAATMFVLMWGGEVSNRDVSLTKV